VSYPLEAARTLRAEELDAAKLGLAAALQRLDAAESELELARVRKEEHAAATREVHAREKRIEARSAAELLQGQSYLRRRRDEAQALLEAEREAQRVVGEATKEAEDARSALADARAQAEAVERHYAKWKAERAAKALRKEEDEADDRSSHSVE